MVTVTTADMELLQQFHAYTFGDVLRLDKFGMVFNPQNAPVNVLIMPLRKSESFHLSRFFNNKK